MKMKKMNTILLISAVSIILLIILGAIIYSWGKSNGYEKRDIELNETQLKLDKKESRLIEWENDLTNREQNLNNTFFNITDYQNKIKEVNELRDKLEEPRKFNFILFSFYYSYNEIRLIIFSIILLLPINLVLFRVVIKNKDVRLFINWVLIILLLIILGVE